MVGRASNDTFISYRRDTGGILAQALFQSLHERGIDTFYDIESIRAGQFGSVILEQIAARPYFVLVLCPGTLERCSDPDDWLRQEIEHALATERVIVPTFTPNFDFGDCNRFLPGGIGAKIRGYQAQELPQRWFKHAVQELVEQYLLPIELASGTASPVSDQSVVQQIQHQAEMAPTVTAEQLSAHEYFERAYNNARDDADGAISDYSEAIRLDPGYVTAFINRGLARKAKGDLEGALADFSEAVRLEPRYAKALYNRGVTRKATGDLDGALADFSEAIRLDPRNVQVFMNRGNTHEGKGDLDGALADYDEAIRLDARNAHAFVNRGDVRKAKGELEAALEDYREAIRLTPGIAARLDPETLKQMGQM